MFNIAPLLTGLHEIKDQVKHLPEVASQRGSLAAVVERPPYQPIPTDESKVKD